MYLNISNRQAKQKIHNNDGHEEHETCHQNMASNWKIGLLELFMQ